MTASILRTSIFSLVFAWSALALAQSQDIEAVEARVMTKSGETPAVKSGTAKTTQEKASVGEGKQAKAQNRGYAKQVRASDAAKPNANGDAKQEKAQKRDGSHSSGASALRNATRAQDRIRTRERSAERGNGAGHGEGYQSATAEHRQERRGAGSGSGAGARAAGSGNGARAGQN